MIAALSRASLGLPFAPDCTPASHRVVPTHSPSRRGQRRVPLTHPTAISTLALGRAERPPTPLTTGRGIDLRALANVLCQIGQVERLDDLGRAGPLLASAGAGSLFHCLFGRDALRMALDLLDDFPRVAEATLLELAALQGVRHDPRAEEEPADHPRAPGRRRRARPELEKLWTFPYYGSVDSTPQCIILLAAYTARFGDAVLDAPIVDRLGRKVTLFDSLRSALR